MYHRTVKYLGLILLFGSFSCANNRVGFVNNQLLSQMVVVDQEIRGPGNDTIDLETVDRQHRTKVFELLANGEIRTAQDKLNAALILQHTGLIYCDSNLRSISAENYLLAHQLAQAALDAGNSGAANFVAVTYDRYLLFTEGYQKYGTQRLIDDKTGEEVWAPIDPATTDTERKRYRVPALDSLKKRFRIMPFSNRN